MVAPHRKVRRRCFYPLALPSASLHSLISQYSLVLPYPFNHHSAFLHSSTTVCTLFVSRTISLLSASLRLSSSALNSLQILIRLSPFRLLSHQSDRARDNAIWRECERTMTFRAMGLNAKEGRGPKGAGKISPFDPDQSCYLRCLATSVRVLNNFNPLCWCAL